MKPIKGFERYAIFQAGGKQYQAIEGKTVAIDLLDAQPGDKIDFDTVMLRKTGEGAFEIGKPFLAGTLRASVVKHFKDKKVIAFRFKRRKKVQVKRGHRQQYTIIRIEAI
ncbi:50S ribosomal protein L21 [Vermiphilus pyriformis]|jgi:large subunit ribosomal protein L21|nr:MAG: 50S ribosomal protein L21 [Vermiphilus pyriformis]